MIDCFGRKTLLDFSTSVSLEFQGTESCVVLFTFFQLTSCLSFLISSFLLEVIICTRYLVLYESRLSVIMEFLHFSVVKCDYPIVEHGAIVSGFRGKYYYNMQVVFQCRDGFYLHGSSTIVCGAKGTWEPELPKCSAKGMKVSVSFFLKDFIFSTIDFNDIEQLERNSFSTFVCLIFISTLHV